MHDLAVLGNDPRFGGGGAAQTDAFLAGARQLGRNPELLYAPHPVYDGRRLSPDRLEAIRQLRAARRFTPAFREARTGWVVATIATAGGAAPRSARPYLCWIGTSVDDEWRGRSGGLGGARRAAFGVSLPVLRRIERAVLRGARRVYATSSGSRDAVAAAGGLDAATVGILPIPVDVDRFSPEPDDRWQERLNAPVLAFVGRAWDPRKNVQLLLDALPAIRASVPGASVRLIGEPPDGPVPQGVEVTGRVDDVAAHLRTASLFVLPSRQEGFGIVAAEALAAGVPVLSTRSGGPEELVERSDAGRLVAHTPGAIAEAAVDLLSDVGTLSAMRRRGRAYVEREHAPSAFLGGLRRAFEDIG